MTSDPTSIGPAWPAAEIGSLCRLLALLAGEREVPAEAEHMLARDAGLVAAVLEQHRRLPGRRGGELPVLDTCLRQLGAPLLKCVLLQAVQTGLDDGDRARLEPHAQRMTRVASLLALGLATEMGYPRPHEAALAGLLHIPTGLSDGSSAEPLADRVESWGYSSFLGDALRYQHLPAEALEDAATLVRIAAASHALLHRPEPEALETATRLTGLAEANLVQTREEAFAAAGPEPGVAGQEEAEAPGDADLLRSLGRFAAVEGLARMPASQREQALSLLGGQLRVVFGLHHALLLEQTADAASLSVRSLDTDAVPDLVLRAHGNHLAAHALQYAVPQTLADASQAASVLDKQLLRWARAEAMLAIPARTGAPGSVLLAFTARDHLKNLARDMPFLRRIVDLAASPAPAQAAPSRGEAQPEDWRGHVRQVVHEVNNPLGIIKNYMAILRVKLGDNPSIGDELRIIQEELDRVARITRQLVSEGGGEAASEAVDLNLLLEDLIRVSEPGMMAHKQVRLEARLDPDLPSLRVDRDRAKQLLLNLLLNAIEASPHGATVGIETHRVIGMRRDSHLEVLISNSGNPIRPDVLAQLFDPQDSGKGPGHAGLGLSIVRSLAQELNASVNCRSYNGGTTFQVLLPLT